MSMEKVYFSYDPIFIVQRVTEIIHEQSKYLKSIPVNNILYQLNREQYDLLFDDYLEHIKYSEKELSITKEFLTGFHAYLIELMKDDINEYEARKSEYFIRDKTTDTYYIHKMGYHTDMLYTLLKKQFKTFDNITSDNLEMYMKFNFEIIGANDEYSMIKFIKELLLGEYVSFDIKAKDYKAIKINQDNKFMAYLSRLNAKQGEAK